MEMRIKTKYITDMENFEPEKWLAISITKEKRNKEDYYFAHIVRNYGITEDTDDYDIGTTNEEFGWIGRHDIAVGKRVFSKDPEKPGVREFEDPVWDTEVNPDTQEETKTLRKGKLVWKYTLPVNEKNTKLMKSIIGTVGINQQTKFYMIKGSTNPIVIEEKTFFAKNVDEVMEDNLQMLQHVKVVPSK